MKLIDDYEVYTPVDYQQKKTDWTLMVAAIISGIAVAYFISVLIG